MLALVAASALLMGLPTLRGTFVGGDDHRLVLDHVLVNHPSFEHAVQLFTIQHRDLYQPLPLLSFSAEFAVAGVLGLFDAGVDAGAWLFHLDNVILHMLNAVLIWILVIRLQRDRVPAATTTLRSPSAPYIIATIAAVLFAVHPLEVEVVAWINGRMMLMSTFFALASLIALAKWLHDENRWTWALLTVLFVAFCAMSKIRVALPALLLIIPLAQQRRMTVRFGILWVICTAVTAVFALVNIQATASAGMFQGAAEHLHGSRVARSLLALAWYFRHVLWPTGLASWYPAPGVVRWSDGATLLALATCVPVLAFMVWCSFRSRAAFLGFVWFFASIASTIGLVPTRNALAADRYMYLPMIGLTWAIGVGVYALYERLARRRFNATARWATGGIGAVIAVAMVLTSWHTAGFYESPTKKSGRIASLYPDTPHVWERAAWAQYNAGEYEAAINLAEREFDHEDQKAHSAAYEVIGASLMKLGRTDDALEALNKAVETADNDSNAKYQLGKAMEELGRTDQAIRFYEESIAKAPLANPRILRLASLYRAAGRVGDARAMYEKVLVNNPYDVPATMALVELDVDEGTPEAYQAANRRLLDLLSWMPENVEAWVNLGVVRYGLGSKDEAIDAYQQALTLAPNDPTALLNLAMIRLEQNDMPKATALFERAATGDLESIDQVTAIHDFFVQSGRPGRLPSLWSRFVKRSPENRRARAFLAWSYALAGNPSRATTEARALLNDHPDEPMALAAQVFASLIERRYGDAVQAASTLCAAASTEARQTAASDARARLRRALGYLLQQRPDDPWTFCLGARLWAADGERANARSFLELCEKQCGNDECQKEVQALRTTLASGPGRS